MKQIFHPKWAFIAIFILFPCGLEAGLIAPALSPGDLIVSDYDPVTNTGSIIKVDPATGAQTLLSTLGLLNRPASITIDNDGAILVANLNGPRGNTVASILRIDPVTGAQTLLAHHGLLQNPTGIVLGSEGSLFVTENPATGSSSIVRVDPGNGQMSLLSYAGLLVNPAKPIESGLSFYLPDSQSILAIDPLTGGMSPVYLGGLLQSPRLAASADLDSNLFVADQGLFSILDPLAGQLHVRSIGGLISTPAGIAHQASSGSVAIAMADQPRIISVDVATGAQTLLSHGGLFHNLTDIATYAPMNMLRGDVNMDGVIDSLDIDLLLRSFNPTLSNPKFDLNLSGGVDEADVDELVFNILNTFYGDANLDGRVSLGDLVILASNFGQATGGTWAGGDFNGNDQMTLGDLVILATYFGQPLPGAPLVSTLSIPVPAALPAASVILAMAALRAARRARKS